jgi:hypothetical protein
LKQNLRRHTVLASMPFFRYATIPKHNTHLYLIRLYTSYSLNISRKWLSWHYPVYIQSCKFMQAAVVSPSYQPKNYLTTPCRQPLEQHHKHKAEVVCYLQSGTLNWTPAVLGIHVFEWHNAR